MGQANRVRYTLLSAIIAAALFLAAAPVPSSGGIPLGDFTTRVTAHSQPAAGDKIADTPQVAFRVLNEAGVQVKGDKDEASTMVAAFRDTFEAFLNAISERTRGAGRGSSSAPEARFAGPSIESCRLLGKVKDCQRCCAGLGYAKQACGRACHITPPPGTTEPTP